MGAPTPRFTDGLFIWRWRISTFWRKRVCLYLLVYLKILIIISLTIVFLSHTNRRGSFSCRGPSKQQHGQLDFSGCPEWPIFSLVAAYYMLLSIPCSKRSPSTYTLINISNNVSQFIMMQIAWNRRTQKKKAEMKRLNGSSSLEILFDFRCVFGVTSLDFFVEFSVSFVDISNVFVFVMTSSSMEFLSAFYLLVYVCRQPTFCQFRILYRLFKYCLKLQSYYNEYNRFLESSR